MQYGCLAGLAHQHACVAWKTTLTMQITTPTLRYTRHTLLEVNNRVLEKIREVLSNRDEGPNMLGRNHFQVYLWRWYTCILAEVGVCEVCNAIPVLVQRKVSPGNPMQCRLQSSVCSKR